MVDFLYVPFVKRFFAYLHADGGNLYLTDQIQRKLDEFFAASSSKEPTAERALRRLFRGSPELFFDGDVAYGLLRMGVGQMRCIRFYPESEQIDTITRGEFLQAKDAVVQGHRLSARSGLVIDFRPFYRDFPKVLEASEVGEGISFLNRHLSAQIYENPKVFRRALVDYLKSREVAGRSVLANSHLTNSDTLTRELRNVRAMLSDFDSDTPYSAIEHDLRVRGFEAGWGADAGKVAENLALLSRVLESPDPSRFEQLLGRLPVIRTVLMVSPHGWFAQDDVLGKPDTGGQVTYVLDQARAMEHALRDQFAAAGLDVAPKVVILTRLIPNADGTTCDLAREQIRGTTDSWIVRVPFHDEAGEIVPEWISRFKIWPYLERFAEEAKSSVVTELLGTPDLIIGHYSDGNLVSHRLAADLGATHCACVHALEKAKYLLSDMHWGEMEHQYHFSVQFTADLIAYNSADFIVASSAREVGGTPDEMGMIESYDMFSIPGLYRVQSGLDPRLARHNIVPPGAAEDYFFPHQRHAERVAAVTEQLRSRFFDAEPTDGCLGQLDNPDLPTVFAMARMDKIKNLSGLVEMYGESPTLRRHANLMIVSSLVDASLSSDQEEIEEVNKVHELMERYELEGHIRWCAARLEKMETGEMYRIVADNGGVFAQPAFLETFGLTVIEAMVCGLPVVVTCFGGPAEIVVNGKSGLVVNPNDHADYAAALEAVVTDRDRWKQFSAAGIKRVQESFTWHRHAESMLRLANVYTYWNYIDVMNRQALDRYIHTLYHTVFRPRAAQILEAQ